MLNKIISEYIRGHKRLVLPNFGAFIRKDTGEVVLVEFLKKDDGVLISLITEQQSVSQQEALEITEQYIAKIKRNVAQSGEYHIEGLGKIYITPNGLYELEYLGGSIMTESDQSTPDIAPQAASTPAPAPVQTERIVSAEARVAQVTAHEPASPQVQPKPAAQPSPTPEPVRPKTQSVAQPNPTYRPARAPQPQKKKSDSVMIIAILAAVIALAAIGFSFLVSGGPASQIVPVNPPIEQVGQ